MYIHIKLGYTAKLPCHSVCVCFNFMLLLTCYIEAVEFARAACFSLPLPVLDATKRFLTFASLIDIDVFYY